MSAAQSPPASANAPLGALGFILDSILERLACVEGKVGIDPPRSAHPSTSADSATTEDGEDSAPHPALIAYDDHVSRCVSPFAESCDAVGLGTVGSDVLATWAGLRSVVVMGTRCKRPKGDASAAVSPHLEPVQEAITRIRKIRLDRKYDNHLKAVVEMLSCASWVIAAPPSMPTPTSFVKETKGSTEFWSNKIRKEYRPKKDEDEGKVQILWCDRLSDLILDLAAYTKKHHLSGLGWNPRGTMDASEYDASATAAAARGGGGGRKRGGAHDQGPGRGGWGRRHG